MNMHTTLSGVNIPTLLTLMPHERQAETWQNSPAAIGIVAAIVDLHAVAGRLETLHMNDLSQLETRSAAETVGRIANKAILREFARGREVVAAPSNGACAVSILWEALAASREKAIEAQMKDEGLELPWADDLTQDQADAAFDRRDELDRDALSVAQVVCLALEGGRA